MNRLLLLFAAIAFAAAQNASATTDPFETALAEIQRGQRTQIEPALRDHVLAPYLAHALLKRKAKPTQAERLAFLKAYPDGPLAQPIAEGLLREFALAALHENVVAMQHYARDIGDRCLVLTSEIALKLRPDAELIADALHIWDTDRSLPAGCDAVIAFADHHKAIGTAQVNTRIEKAFATGQAQLGVYLSQRLPKSDQVAYTHAHGLLHDPASTRRALKSWPDDAAHQQAVSLAIARLAKRDAGWAATLWREATARFSFSAAQKARMIDPIALYRANDYASDAVTWLSLIDEGLDSAPTREWRVREALSRDDVLAADHALKRMDATQLADPRWRYWRAVIDQRLKRTDAAELGFRLLSESPSFFGFLAADRINEPYTLCPRTPPEPAAAGSTVSGIGGVQRALALFRLGRKQQARQEWDFVLPKLTESQKVSAVVLAHDAGWYDRAPFALTAAEEMRYYSLRFPNAYLSELVKATGQRTVRPSFAAGVMRAESALVVDAVSGAQAYGLIQLLPSTAKRMAKAEGLVLTSNQRLFEPEFNIRLGTRYLDELLAKQEHAEYAVLAAYNAGPSRLAKWKAERGHLPVDVFIETIPFKETREYIARVLSFDVIYDWRLNGEVLPIGERLKPGLGTGTAAARPVRCLTSSATPPAAPTPPAPSAASRGP
ncbi:MAG: lytic transglycosylase domain-containing protein [Ahniella sp.]|nr:lytic transglycosylase domain-containing protein [Ahniella sp.]